MFRGTIGATTIRMQTRGRINIQFHIKDKDSTMLI